jgi:DNA-directed RNA polymerase subunit E'
MYKILEVEDKIRVPPTKFSMETRDAVKSSLEDRWEGKIDKNMGVILSVVSISDIGEGRILPEDPAIHYPVRFSMMVYTPELHEVVNGEVIDVTEFGVFIRIGPVDGMIHVSQIMDDFVSYDSKNANFIGKESNRKLKEADVVRARIISVSAGEREYKIGLTARQAGLGAFEWIDADKKRGEARAAKAAGKSAEKPAAKKKEEKKKE